MKYIRIRSYCSGVEGRLISTKILMSTKNRKLISLKIRKGCPNVIERRKDDPLAWREPQQI
jgi:hypothetical protein